MMAEAAAPAARALKMNRMAAPTMTRRLPQRVGDLPARKAPSAQPGNRALTVTPSHASLRLNVLRRPSWVPLMTPLS